MSIELLVIAAGIIVATALVAITKKQWVGNMVMAVTFFGLSLGLLVTSDFGPDDYIFPLLGLGLLLWGIILYLRDKKRSSNL